MSAITITLGKRPNPKQLLFFKARAKYICYGGARGGGKSWGMRTKFVMLACKYPGLRLLLLRRTLPELRENHIRPLQKMLHGVAVWRDKEMTFTFSNGSVLKMGYCKAESDTDQYQGQEYDVIGMEEATHFTEHQFTDLTLCLRTTRTDFKPRMYFTCNPGNVGHAWVKRLFIDRDYRAGEKADDYVFIQAKVYDNRVLMNANPEYVKALESLPEDQRRAMLDGDWDVYLGQFFTEWRRELHVMEPIPIQPWWQCYRAIDYGLDRLACLWCAFDDVGNAYVYRELCVSNTIVSDAARLILAAGDEPITATFMPADLLGKSSQTGESIYEKFASSGLQGTPVKNTRVAGWATLKEWMHPVNDGAGNVMPRLRVFSTCRELIQCIPQLQFATTGDPSDVATEPHEITHAPDALRYMMDGRPSPGERPLEDAYQTGRRTIQQQSRNILSYGGRR